MIKKALLVPRNIYKRDTIPHEIKHIVKAHEYNRFSTRLVRVCVVIYSFYDLIINEDFTGFIIWIGAALFLGFAKPANMKDKI